MQRRNGHSFLRINLAHSLFRCTSKKARTAMHLLILLSIFCWTFTAKADGELADHSSQQAFSQSVSSVFLFTGMHQQHDGSHHNSGCHYTCHDCSHAIIPANLFAIGQHSTRFSISFSANPVSSSAKPPYRPPASI